MEGLFSFNLLNTVEFSDSTGSLGTHSSGLDGVGKSGNFLVSLLDEGEGEHLDIGANNASSDGFSLSLSGSFGSVSLSTG